MGDGPCGSVEMAFFWIRDERRGLSLALAWGWPFFWIRDKGWGLSLALAGDGSFWDKR
jgi:hypothetical protein